MIRGIAEINMHACVPSEACCVRLKEANVWSSKRVDVSPICPVGTIPEESHVIAGPKSEHWHNAQVIAAIPNDEIRQVSFMDLIARGLITVTG